MKSTIILYLAGAVLGLLLWFLVLLLACPIAIVQIDATTGEYIRVVFKNDRHDCNTPLERIQD